MIPSSASSTLPYMYGGLPLSLTLLERHLSTLHRIERRALQ